MELCVKGRNAQARGDIALARKCLNDAIKADDRNAHAWMALGILEFETNTTSDVDQDIEEERRRSSGEPRAA